MSTQKQKFELFQRLQSLGFTYEESAQLRRIEMTLQRWAELECGTGDDRVTRSVERDESTGKPFMRVQYATAQGWQDRRYPIADREAGALRRLKAIVKARNEREGCGPINPFPIGSRKAGAEPIVAYHQTDPRGCALYLVKRSDIPAGSTIDSCYNRGLAVCC